MSEKAVSQPRRRYLQGDEAEDPVLSAINIVDIFLVVIAVLVIIISQNPLNPFAEEDVTVVKNPGKENMEILIKEGQELKHYKSTGEIGEGEGMRAGVAYRLADGTMIYVPEGDK
jgi:hypothetical protein